MIHAKVICETFTCIHESVLCTRSRRTANERFMFYQGYTHVGSEHFT